MKEFNRGDKVKIINIRPRWYQFLLKQRLKHKNVVGYVNKFLEHYLAYEVYTNEGVWLVIPSNLELLK